MTKAIAASALYSPMKKNLKALASIARGEHRRVDLVGDYERAFARLEGVKHAVATSLARVGLYQVLRALSAKPGEKILMAPVNIPEMVSVVRLLGLEPVFIEWGAGSLFPDVEDLREKIASSGARIFFSTIVAGQVGELKAIRDLCHSEGVTLVQDCTQANLTSYQGRSLSKWADLSIYSTCELKFIHAYRGAFVCTEDDDLAAKLRSVVSDVHSYQGTPEILRKWFSDTAASVVLHPALFGRVFHHFQNAIFVQDPLSEEAEGLSLAGFSFFKSDASDMKTSMPERMVFRASNYEALAGGDSLRRVSALVDKHKAIAGRYGQAFESLNVLPRLSPGTESSFWRFPLLLASGEAAERFLRSMRSKKIVVERSGLSLLSRDLPRTRSILERTVFLPCHAGLRDADVERVIAETFLVLRDEGMRA